MRLSIEESVPFTENEYKKFLSHGTRQTYSKNEFLLQSGQRTDALHVILNGLVRGYRIINGEEITHHFFKPGWFATDYFSYLTGSPGDLFLETVTETSTVKYTKHSFESLFEKNPKYATLGRVLAEKSYLVMAKRAKQFQSDNLKQRYLDLVDSDPSLFHTVPHKHIASYLGVAPQSLSRLRASLAEDQTFT